MEEKFPPAPAETEKTASRSAVFRDASPSRGAALNRFITHPVSPVLSIHITREMPAPPTALERRIDALWSDASARVAAGGARPLFNGRIFSIDTIAPDRVTGHLTEYRRHVAQLEDNTLFDTLGIRSLAVCGVLHCSVGVAIGRRHGAAVYQPGMWQLCPAGSVDANAARSGGTIDYQAQLLSELSEEPGISPEQVSAPTPLCLVEHPGSHVRDLGLAMRSGLGATEIAAAHRERGDGEYDTLLIVSVAELPGFVRRVGATLVPPAPVFLSAAGLLSRADSLRRRQ